MALSPSRPSVRWLPPAAGWTDPAGAAGGASPWTPRHSRRGSPMTAGISGMAAGSGAGPASLSRPDPLMQSQGASHEKQNGRRIGPSLAGDPGVSEFGRDIGRLLELAFAMRNGRQLLPATAHHLLFAELLYVSRRL